KRPEIAMRDIAAAVVGVDHDADRAALRHRALHLVDRGAHIDMQGHERDAFQALPVDRAPIVEPVIVGLAERDRVIRLADAREEKAAGRINDLQIDALAVVVGEVLRGVLGLLRDLAVLAAVEAVHRRDEVALLVPLGKALAIDRLVIDGVTVGIDDQHAVLHRAGPPGSVLIGPDDTTGGARPATRARAKGGRLPAAWSSAASAAA